MFLRMVGEYGHRSNKLYRALTKGGGGGGGAFCIAIPG